MVYKLCCVPVCKNTTENEPTKLFLSAPQQPKRRQSWAYTLKLPNIPTHGRYCVCEDHFNLSEDSSNWSFFKLMGEKLILKPDILPHRYIQSPPRERLSPQLSDCAKKRKLENLELLKKATTAEEAPSSKKRKDSCLKKTLFENEVIMIPSKSKILKERYSSPREKFVTTEGVEKLESCKFLEVDVLPQKHSKNVGIQVCIKKKNHSIKTNTTPVLMKEAGTMTKSYYVKNIKSSPAAASTSSSSKVTEDTFEYTYSSESLSEGSAEYKLADSKEIRKKSTLQLIESNSRFYLGLPKGVYVLVHLITKWVDVSYINVLITLKKIKQNDVYARLADDFGMSVSNIQRIFVSSVPKIANVMQNLVFWPDQRIVKRLLPIPFRYRYNNVVSIIDCLEVEIEKPSNPLRQSITWSEYKKCNTLKFLISSTPNGFINFISGAFGGRISDHKILVESGFLRCLPNSVSIMADRGFKQITALLISKDCTLVRPPSVSEEKRNSADEVREAKRIAALRIHVERVIRRIREFEMLHSHSQINNNLLYLMDCIILIICGLINVQEPLIR